MNRWVFIGVAAGCIAALAPAPQTLAQDAPTATNTGDVPFAGVPRAERDEPGEAIAFYVLAGWTVISGLGIALSRSVVRMAVWLFSTLATIAGLYFLLAANFLAAIQLIVYAGGTLILLIFGVMLTTKSPWVRFVPRGREVVGGGAVCLLLLAALLTAVRTTNWPAEQAVSNGATVARFGKELLTTYLVPFEAVSVLLLVVMIGAAYLARQEKEEE